MCFERKSESGERKKTIFKKITFFTNKIIAVGI